VACRQKQWDEFERYRQDVAEQQTENDTRQRELLEKKRALSQWSAQHLAELRQLCAILCCCCWAAACGDVQVGVTDPAACTMPAA
jgi:hypothetical protein